MHFMHMRKLACFVIPHSLALLSLFCFNIVWATILRCTLPVAVFGMTSVKKI